MAGTFVRNSIVNAVAGVCTTFGGFASSIVIARLLGVQGTGAVAFATWAVTVAVIVADIGVPGALSRFLPEAEARDPTGSTRTRLTGALLKPYLVASFALTLGFTLYAAWLAVSEPGVELWDVDAEHYARQPLFWVLIAYVCLVQAMGNFVLGWLKGMQRFGDLARLAALTAVFQVVSTALGAWSRGIAGAMLGSGIGVLLPALALVLLRTGGRPLPTDLVGRIRRFSFETWGAYLVSAFFASRMEVFFLERSWGSHAVGLFTVSLTLSNLATQGPLLLTGALLPHISHQIGRNEMDRAQALYPTSARLLALAVFPACLGTAALAPVLLPLMYGQSFAPAVPTATILVAGAALTTGTSIANVYMVALERTRFILLAGLVCAGLSVLSGLTLVPLFGPLAAAGGRMAVQLALTGATLWYVHRRLHCVTPWRDLARLLAGAAACALVARLVVVLLPDAGGVALAIALGAATYALALRLLRPLPAADLGRLREMAGILPARLRPLADLSLTLIRA